MTVKEVHDSLKNLVEKSEKIKQSVCDISGDIKLGIDLSSIKHFAKQIGKDPVLADELYAGNLHDAKVLATFIDIPDEYSRDEILRRAEQIYPSEFGKQFSYNVLAKSNHAVHFIDEWSHSGDEDLKMYAYYALQKLAKCKNSLSQAFYFDRLTTIGHDIHHVSDHVAEAMMASLEAIGDRNAYLKRMSAKTHASIQSITQKNLAAERKSILAEKLTSKELH